MAHIILQQIKEQTKERHLALEKNQRLSLLTNSDIEIQQYLNILRKFYGFFAPLESKINHFTAIYSVIPDLGDRRKATALLSDISFISKKETSETEIADCDDLPSVSNISEALGCLYVLEGSTLGGRFIYKNLEESLNLNHVHGAAFFYGYGADTGPKWKNFQTCLSNYFDQKPEESTSAIKTAVDTFEKLDQWFKN